MNKNKNARRGFLYIKRAYFLSSNSAFTFQCKEFHIEYGQTAKTMGRERGDGSRVERKPMQYVPQYSQRLILVDYVKSSSFSDPCTYGCKTNLNINKTGCRRRTEIESLRAH